MHIAHRALQTALLFTFAACQGQLLKINVDQSSETVVSKGTLLEALAGDFGFGDLVAMDLTAQGELANQGVQPGDISKATLTQFDLSATAPAGADLSFLTSLGVYVEAPGLDRVLIASADSFPVGEDLVQLDLKDVDLGPYIVSQSMTISTDVEGRRPETDTTVRADFNVLVGVTGQGACNYIKSNDK